MVKWLLLLVVGCLHVLTATKGERKLCTDAKKECQYNDLSCTLAYISFEGDCPHINEFGTTGPSTDHKNCSKACVRAIEELKQTKAGSELYDCDCLLDGQCLTMKARVARCLVTKSEVPKKTGCTKANRNCRRNADCMKLQQHFLQACNDLINGVKCEQKCLKAQSKLFESEYGKALFSCECDGITEPYCRALRGHAEQLRCLPGQDGSGTRNFEYFEATNTDIIHGGKETRAGSLTPENSQLSTHSVSLAFTASWQMVLALLTFS